MALFPQNGLSLPLVVGRRSCVGFNRAIFSRAVKGHVMLLL